MSEHQKENLISLISTLFATTIYFAYILNKYSGSSLKTEEELKFWASAVLILIPIRLVVQVVIYILFKIIEAIRANGVLQKEVKDERDVIIEAKGDRISSSLFIIGFMIALLGVVFFNSSISTMFIIILIGGFVSELIGILSKFSFYQKGI